MLAFTTTTMRFVSIIIFSLLLSYFTSVDARIHHFVISSDTRLEIDLLEFGFQQGGSLRVDVQNFSVTSQTGSGTGFGSQENERHKVGFSLSRGEALKDRLKSKPQSCVLEDSAVDRDLPAVFFLYDFEAQRLQIVRQGESLEKLKICEEKELLDCMENLPAITLASGNTSAAGRRPENGTGDLVASVTPYSSRILNSVPLQVATADGGNANGGNLNMYSFQFSVFFYRGVEEGYYYLMYHNCYNYYREHSERLDSSFDLSMEAMNGQTYLSAGDIPYPVLLFALAALFMATFIVWSLLLKATKQDVFKIHYLMAVLVFIKSMSLLFHGVDFYFISKYGHQQEVWAVVYYIMHLLKGALLFGVVILIGTGWTFFKHFLTDRDKRILMVVMPLQVLNNIALIIVEEAEESDKNFLFWWQVMTSVDLICCAAIILPVIWSIRHLQEASQTDGKAAFNLTKLKLFRHFYILVICYIYLTKIVKYLIVFTVPFKYVWVNYVVTEVGTWLFFITTGYQFKPAPNNPYLELSQSDDELEMDEVSEETKSGLLETVVRIKKPAIPKRRYEAKDTVMAMNGGHIEQQELID